MTSERSARLSLGQPVKRSSISRGKRRSVTTNWWSITTFRKRTKTDTYRPSNTRPSRLRRRSYVKLFLSNVIDDDLCCVQRPPDVNRSPHYGEFTFRKTPSSLIPHWATDCRARSSISYSHLSSGRPWSLHSIRKSPLAVRLTNHDCLGVSAAWKSSPPSLLKSGRISSNRWVECTYYPGPPS